MKQIVTEKEAHLPLDGLEVMDDELMFVLGGAAAAGGGEGCGCGCVGGTGCGCVGGMGCGCGCECAGGTGCGCGCNSSPSGTTPPQ